MPKTKKKRWVQLDLPVFGGASLIIWGILILSVADQAWSERFWSNLYQFTSHYLGWVYILSVAIFVAFVFYLAMSSLGRIRLGPQTSGPEYTFGSWLSMLFSAGMGIGLVFNCVSEPVLHLQKPPIPAPSEMAAAGQAMKFTYLHWGIHAWAIYAVVGLAVAYFHYRKGYPINIRNTLRPILGKHTEGPVGYAADILAIVGTLFGVAASLGYGSAQVNSGLHHLIGFPKSDGMQVVIIVVITGIAMASVVSGLSRGIKYLSVLNMILGAVLLAFVLLSGPTIEIFYGMIRTVGDYLQEFPRLTLNPAGRGGKEWLANWTLSYWGWWIAWAPFVGIFIARISKGRTIREFVFGVTLAPTLITFLWMSSFGEQALMLIQGGDEALALQIQEDKTIALFLFLEGLPLSTVTSVVATLLVATFFVTSSDSGSLVVDMLASGGAENPPVKQKVYWASLEGAVAAALVLAGGLAAVQSASLNAAVPFTLVMLLMCWSLLKELKKEKI